MDCKYPAQSFEETCYNKISVPSVFICSQGKEHGNDANVFSKKAKRYTKKMLKESDINT